MLSDTGAPTTIAMSAAPLLVGVHRIRPARVDADERSLEHIASALAELCNIRLESTRRVARRGVCSCITWIGGDLLWPRPVSPSCSAVTDRGELLGQPSAEGGHECEEA